MTASHGKLARPRVRIHLESRYRKLERGLPQTVFWCPECKGHKRRRKDCPRCEGAGKLTRDSVQELIARKVLPAFRARAGKFHGAGREDLDVLMLGRGRPFVFEVVRPRRLDVDLDELVAEINESCRGRIEIEPFVRVPRSRVAHWKESRFDKVYGASVRLERPVPEAAVAELEARVLDVRQRTPRRVAHRRADLERERRVEILSVRRVEPARLDLRLRCAHGTYVKEWISGDEGRTRPALPDLLGVTCLCETLDVLDIELPGPSRDPQPRNPEAPAG